MYMSLLICQQEPETCNHQSSISTNLFPRPWPFLRYQHHIFYYPMCEVEMVL